MFPKFAGLISNVHLGIKPCRKSFFWKEKKKKRGREIFGANVHLANCRNTTTRDSSSGCTTAHLFTVLSLEQNL